MEVVTVEDLVVSYGGRPVLDHVSLTVDTAEMVAILGANGSGKSTLIRAALGLVHPVTGTAKLFGTPLRKFRDWRRIGYVPQRLGAGSGVPATVREVVASGRLARRRLTTGFTTSVDDRRAVADALATVDLADKARSPVGTLSGGQQQRVLIARALAGEPELLVLDEPTAGVDAASQEAFAEALKRFAGQGGTVLLVAHELGPLRPLITRAVVVHHGSIIHNGAVPEPAGHHAEPGHDHVHPHGPVEQAGFWS
jgi:zinc transport system ATP-binding protein